MSTRSAGTCLSFFSPGCIGLHIWTRCLRNEQGRIPLSHIPCPICRAPLDEIISDTANRRDLLSRFPFEGVFDSPTRRFFPFTDNVPAPICFNPPSFFPISVECSQLMSLPWTAVPYDFSINNQLLDSSIAQEAAIQFPFVQKHDPLGIQA